jgi:hypothetical protein
MMRPEVKPLVWLIEIMIGVVVVAGLPLFYIGATLGWCRSKLKGEPTSFDALKPGQAFAFRANRWDRY